MIPDRLRRRMSRPVDLLTFAMALSLAALLWLGWHSYSCYGAARTTRERGWRAEELRGTIVHLDEVLTMSARMAAATGDPRWEKRYRGFEPKLDAAIKEAMRLAPEAHSGEAAARTDQANLELVAMENRAFDLLRQGRTDQARALLFSDEYEAQKKVYAEGMTAFAAGLSGAARASLARQQRRALLDIALAVLVIPFMIAGWLVVFRAARRWEAARQEQSRHLAALSRDLDRRVAQRTSELDKANEGLKAEIAERKQAEQELRESRNKLRVVFENAGGAIFVADATTGMILDCNHEATKLLGREREEIVGLHQSQIHPAGEEERYSAKFIEHLRKGHASDFEAEVQHKDGRRIRVCISAQSLALAGRDVIIGLFMDVTHRKRAEAEIIQARKQAERANRQFAHRAEELEKAKLALLNMVDDLERRGKELRAASELRQKLLDTAATAIFTVDLDSRITSVNQAFCTLTGFGADEVIGKRCSVLNGDPCCRECTLFDAGRTEPIVRKECTIQGKDGRRRVVLKSAALLRDESGQATGGIESFMDVTELVEAQAASEAASHTKSEFLANMSHEIRTPMNGIIGMTELALETELTAEQREYLEMANASADSLLRLLDDILDFSKVEAGRLELENMGFDLRDCLGDTVGTLSVRAAKKGLELACHIRPDVPGALMGDPGRLRQIIVNLVGNAIKFTDAGEVVVKVETQSQTDEEVWLRFSVRDTGIGIPPEDQGRVFDTFSQADGSTTRKYGGTGLGLAISSQLVGLMGGRMGLESEVGKGSTFHFTARFAPWKEAPAPAAQAGVEELENLPVLVVDDNPTNRRILDEMLSSWRMNPASADGGAAALEAMEKTRDGGEAFRLVILDVCMPGMDGFAVAERIREDPSLAGASIMMLSSAGRRGDVARCRELGIAAYLTKPIKQSDLLDAILTVLGSGEGRADRSGPLTRHSLREGRRLRVLLAEDNAVNQRLAVRVLEKRGHDVSVASDGREAIAAFEAGQFDLVLMDVQMPEVGGFEAVAAIRQAEGASGEHVPIIAMTAHAMKGDREKCLSAGMDGYVAKPIRRAALFDEISRVLAGLPAAPGADLDAGADDSLPAGSAEATGEGVMDIVEAMRRVDGDEGLLRELAQLFVQGAPEQMSQMREALAAGDAERLARAAHSLKGTVGNFGAKAAFDAALNLTTVASKGLLEKGEEALGALEEEVARLTAALEALVKEAEPCES